MSTVAQIIGLILCSVAGWLLWSPWALLIGGGLLLIVPELAALRRRR